jgi:hypothetical protein
LRRKAGSKATLKEFRRMVRKVMVADSLPEYRWECLDFCVQGR